MYCTQCGASVTDGARFCGKCGAAVQVAPVVAMPATVTVGPAVAQQVVPQIRPWVRYWARMFDICLFSLGVGLLIGIFAPQAFSEKGSDLLFGIVLLFGWVFVEALLLSTFGTTPGKWLLKIRLTPPSGSAMSYSAALSRSIKVWWRGLGIGFPPVSLITLIVAQGRLTRNAITSWDREGAFVVSHEQIGAGRVLAAIAFFIIFLVLIAVGSARNV